MMLCDKNGADDIIAKAWCSKSVQLATIAERSGSSARAMHTWRF